MFAADFDYYRAGSVAEAGQLLAQHPGAKLLAGGHSLIPLLKLRLASPGAVIDIGRITELRGITAGNGGLRIGALTTHAELAASAEVRQHAEALAEAAGQVGDPAVRNRGTIGGNIAHADPASDLPIVLSALGATVAVAGANGERSIAAAAFFQGVMMTALGEHDLLTAIDLPAAASGQGTAYAKFRTPRRDTPSSGLPPRSPSVAEASRRPPWPSADSCRRRSVAGPSSRRSSARRRRPTPSPRQPLL